MRRLRRNSVGQLSTCRQGCLLKTATTWGNGSTGFFRSKGTVLPPTQVLIEVTGQPTAVVNPPGQMQRPGMGDANWNRPGTGALWTEKSIFEPGWSTFHRVVAKLSRPTRSPKRVASVCRVPVQTSCSRFPAESSPVPRFQGCQKCAQHACICIYIYVYIHSC